MTGAKDASNRGLTMEPGENTPCFGCMNRECRTGLSRIKNPGALPGQAPETGTPCRVLLSQALPVLLPPVLGFFAGFVLLGALTGRESLGILGGFTGCFLAALGVYLLRRGSPQK